MFGRSPKIHANTVSQAYQELVDRHWVTRHRGRRMVVRSVEERPIPREEDLDDLIDATIRKAREKGYSLRRADSPGPRAPAGGTSGSRPGRDARGGDGPVDSGRNFPGRFGFPWKHVRLEEFSANRGTAIGALIVCMPGVVWDLAQLLPTGRSLVPIEPSKADEQFGLIQRFEQPSLIAVVSISPYFLSLAQGVLAPLVGTRHTLEAYCLRDGESKNLSGADMVFCDSITAGLVRVPRVVPYSIVSEDQAREIGSLIQARQD